jgi:hypothetical protein
LSKHLSAGGCGLGWVGLGNLARDVGAKASTKKAPKKNKKKRSNLQRVIVEVLEIAH